MMMQLRKIWGTKANGLWITKGCSVTAQIREGLWNRVELKHRGDG